MKIQNSKFCLIYFTAALCIFFTNKISAQNSSVSPYSRFGIGETSSIMYARNLALGGTEIGLDQPGYINFSNPAGLSALYLTTYEFGMEFTQYELRTSLTKQRTNSAGLSYFELAFPIKAQNWSLSFGLSPYSKVGYSVTDKLINDFQDVELRTYQGSGGINNFHISGGKKITHRLSFGVSAEYLFGVINNNRTVGFQNPFYYNTMIESSTSIGWFHFKGGLQYHMDSLKVAKSDSLDMYDKKLGLLQAYMEKIVSKDSSNSAESYAKKNETAQEIAQTKLLRESVVEKHKKTDWHLVLGLVAAPAMDLHARNSTLIRSFRYFQYSDPNAGILIRDTIQNTEGEKGNIRIPLSLGFGLSVLKANRWVFCSDITWQQWSDFSFLGAEDSLVDSWRASVGVQFVPKDRVTRSKFLNYMNYRLGFHYEQSFLDLYGENIKDYGISAGFGIPLRKVGTMLHFTWEAGKRGTTNRNLVEEKYIKFTFGFTINDKWFIPSKYD